MVEIDIAVFRDDLLAMFDTLSHGRIAPTDRQIAMWFRLLREYPLPAVRDALEAFMREPGTGRSLPVPSDVIAKLESVAKDDGRLGADEAWAIALQAVDEEVTVVWTAEIAEAWGIARSVFNVGDEVGARVAFRDAYNRLVGAARAERVPVAWQAALGHAKHLQAGAIDAATALGRIAPDPDMLRLEAPPLSIDQLATKAPPHARELLLRMKARMAEKLSAPSQDAIAKVETNRLRDEAAQRVADYGAQA